MFYTKLIAQKNFLALYILMPSRCNWNIGLLVVLIFFLVIRPFSLKKWLRKASGSRKNSCVAKKRRLVTMMMPSLLLLMMYFVQLREIELKVQREINEKRQELLAKEESLR